MNTRNDNQHERATPRAWEQIRADYISGEGSLRQLAMRHDLPLSTVEARSKREGWFNLREKRQKAALQSMVGVQPENAVVGQVGDRKWWEEHDREHVQQNLELTRRLRRAVDAKIAGATSNELERLGGALEAIVRGERVLLELTPRSGKDKSPSLRPSKPKYGSAEWQAEFDRTFELLNGKKRGTAPTQAATSESGQTTS